MVTKILTPHNCSNNINVNQRLIMLRKAVSTIQQQYVSTYYDIAADAQSCDICMVETQLAVIIDQLTGVTVTDSYPRSAGSCHCLTGEFQNGQKMCSQ